MKEAVMDRHFYDLDTTSRHQGGVVEFTQPDDRHWSGVVELLPEQAFSISTGCRTDIYVIYGEAVRDTGEVAAIGDYLSIYQGGQLIGAFGGAILLVYREPAPEGGMPVDLLAAERLWRPAQTAGLHIADLTTVDHQVALIRWEPGTYVPPHMNPRGEELFVLKGELHVNSHALPAGSWLRLGAGERHDSGADQLTLILLRSGHLAPLQHG